MTMKRKILSAITASLLIGSTAFAQTPLDTAVTDLQELGIIDKAGDVRADELLTKAEAVKIITKLHGRDLTNEEAPTENIFNDVSASHWAAKYIQYAKSVRIVNGDENGNFNPEDSVTFAQMIKMLVCSIGYDSYADAEGGYPRGYIKYGMKLTINNNIGGFMENDSITRGDAMIMAHNALDVPLVLAVGYTTDGFGMIAPQIMVMDGSRGMEKQTLRTRLADSEQE